MDVPFNPYPKTDGVIPMGEMNKLIVMLAKADIPFEVYPFHVADYDGYSGNTFQICTPSRHDMKIDAVCHNFSYGGKEGLIEVMAEGMEDVCGFLSAAEAFPMFRDAANGITPKYPSEYEEAESD